MLRGISPLLSPDLLHVLAAMGHGDDIVIVDANFPGTSNAKRLVRMDGISATDVLEAVLQIMPLDDFVPDPAATMQVVGNADEVPPVVQMFQEIVNRTADNPANLASVERHAFYAKSRDAFAIIQTGETRLYGNILLKKGVIKP